jgi:Tol biopolymer transport system component
MVRLLPILALALALTADVAHASFPGSNGRLAFVVEKWRTPATCSPSVPHSCEPEPYASTIETVLPSGRERRVLRSSPAGEWPVAPSWSPSGRALAFEQGERLGIVRSNGTGWRLLPKLTSGEHSPAWSPNGRRLGFTGSSVCCNWLYTVRTDGRDLRRVIAQEALAPAWSVLGTIAFVNVTGVRPEYSRLEAGLYTVRPDRSRLRRVFRDGADPDWSPDGRRIAFGFRGEIFVVGSHGRQPRQLTSGAERRVRSSSPTWSPDGRYIAFLRDDDLYVMRSSGGGLRRLVHTPAPDPARPGRPWATLGAPTWQPLRR